MWKSEDKTGRVQILSLALLFLLFLLVPRGCSLTRVVVGVDREGRNGIFLYPDPSLIQQLRERQLFYVGEGLIEKKDYFFFVDYFFQARVQRVSSQEPYYLKLQLPGKISEGNPDEIREDGAFWVLNAQKAGGLKLKSRAYRYYVILAFLFALSGLLFNYLPRVSLFQKEKPSGDFFKEGR